MSIVGIDLAGVETRQTGFCKLTSVQAVTCNLYTDKEIIEKTIDAQPELVTIDAPLSLPPGRKSIEERTSIHLRESDRALLRMGIKLFPITIGPMRKLTARGISLRETFECMGFRVLEAYPGGAQDVWGIPRKQRGLDKMRVGLEGLGIEGLNAEMSDHELDAATIAYVGKLFLEGDAIVYGDEKLGIVLPKPRSK
ncbi:MAG: DUF429 domain-containing protein [Crenarchaeota archaeon]|jgi:predicted nuclease with RNAse H fold|nr:DUF429 domain-containing protein [Thermoproteota archaeon]